MRNSKKQPSCIFILIFFITLPKPTYSQAKCDIFTEYQDDIKIWAASTIDSLKKQGIDTILYYGVGAPNTVGRSSEKSSGPIKDLPANWK